MLGGIPIGKAFGISLKLHWSWFIIFGLVTWALAGNYFPITYPNWTLSTKIIAGIITSLLFFSSVLAHELMHSIVAIREGIHIEAITLFILGGVSQMTEEPKTAKDEFRMAIAGPGTSLVLGGIFVLIFIGLGGKLTWSTFIGIDATIPNTSGFAAQFIGAIALWLGYINLALGVFNLIPGYPLDGGRVLRSLIWWSNGKIQGATRIAANIGRAIGFIFILVGIYYIFTGGWLNGIWLALIGWFLESAASGSYRQMVIQDMLKGHSASEIMSRDCQMVAADLTIERLVNENIMASGRRCFPVVAEGRVQGMITLRDIQKVPRQEWNYKLVRDAMTPLNKLKAIKPDEDLSTVMNTLSQNDINQLPVIKDDTVLGMVARENIINFINIRTQLNKQ
jgi:Zn-dependent protease/CBS domain-containing protein